MKINTTIKKNDSKLLLKPNNVIKDDFDVNNYDDGAIGANGHLGSKLNAPQHYNNKRKRMHTRTRLDTPDREKLERLAAISGVV